nr:hypothetical protein CFP56_50927 [Quercus suber]
MPFRLQDESESSFLSPRETAQQSAPAQEPETAEKADEGQPGGRPEQRTEEAGRARVGLVGEAELVDIVAGDGDGEQRVGENPERDETRAEGLVRVLERLLRVFLRGVIRRKGTFDRRFEGLVDVRLRDVDLFNHGSFAVGCFLSLSGGEGVGFVCTFSSPRDVVPITEGIDHEDVDVGGGHEEILATGSEEGFDEFINAIIDIDVGRVLRCERSDDQIEGVDDDVELDQGENHKGRDVRVSASLGSVAECQDELQQQEGQIDVFDDGVENRCHRVAKGKRTITVSSGRRSHQIDDDRGRQVI